MYALDLEVLTLVPVPVFCLAIAPKGALRLSSALKLPIEPKLKPPFSSPHFQELMAAVSGAIWKCAFSPENVTKFQDLGLVEVLIRILKDNCDALDDLQFNPQKISVLTNVVGALAECAKNEQNVNVIRDEGGLEPLIKLINTTHPDLLVNVSLALGRCAEDKNTLINIHELDGVRLIWSLLKNPSDRVSCWAKLASL